MTTQFFTNNIFGVGTRATITDNNGVYIGGGATVGSTDDYAITAGGMNVSIDVDGTLYGALGGLKVTGGSSMIVRIGADGGIGADLSFGSAIEATGFAGAIENHGLLKGSHAFEAFGQVNAEISNYGEISTTDQAISLDQATTGSVQFFNYGTMTSQTGFSTIYDSAGKTSDFIINSGVINGMVDLGAGSDAYIGVQAKASDAGLLSLIFQIEGNFGKIASFVNGGAGNDMLLGGKLSDFFIGGVGKDQITTGDGVDYLVGSFGADLMTGGKGRDTFAYQTVADSRGKKFDVIEDFSTKQNDVFDFQAIDANSTKVNDQSFNFIGEKQFSGKAGELRFDFEKGDTIIYGNIDGDKQAEFEIHLEGKVELHQGDFLL